MRCQSRGSFVSSDTWRLVGAGPRGDTQRATGTAAPSAHCCRAGVGHDRRRHRARSWTAVPDLRVRATPGTVTGHAGSVMPEDAVTTPCRLGMSDSAGPHHRRRPKPESGVTSGVGSSKCSRSDGGGLMAVDSTCSGTPGCDACRHVNPDAQVVTLPDGYLPPRRPWRHPIRAGLNAEPSVPTYTKRVVSALTNASTDDTGDRISDTAGQPMIAGFAVIASHHCYTDAKRPRPDDASRAITDRSTGRCGYGTFRGRPPSGTKTACRRGQAARHRAR